MRCAIIILIFLAGHILTNPSPMQDGILLNPEIDMGEKPSEDEKAHMQASFGRLPLYFIKYQGQMDAEVAYYVKGADKTLYFTSEGITFSLSGKDEEEQKRWTAKLDFVDANPEVSPKGDGKQKAIFSYFKGKPEDWNTGIPTFSRVVYEDLWPGIDLAYTGTVNRLKYEFLVKPGADPTKIRFAYRGATDLSVKEKGELVVTTPMGILEDGMPYAYQEISGERSEVAMKYALQGKTEEEAFLYGFELGAYDPKKPLVLDPAMLVYCGYIGGSGDDWCRDIAVDSDGNSYVSGWTNSDETTFPVKVGPDLTYNGGEDDAFVAKVKADGMELIYCGYIGGDAGESGIGIVVDSDRNAYITGITKSDETTFPVKIGPDLTYNGDGGIQGDAFVAKINPNGTELLYCGYIGGDDGEAGHEIAIDSNGNIYIAGWTYSDETTFPVKIGPDLTYNGGYNDHFVAKVKADGTELLYCGYIGGNKTEGWGGDIEVDSNGNAYVLGSTESHETTFPVKVGPDLTYNGGEDAFVAKVKTDGTELIYCGYIGGSGLDMGLDIALDSDGNSSVVGYARSNEATFPVKVGPDLTFNGGLGDAFVAKVKSDGTELLYCGYIGGNGNDGGYSIALDSDVNAYVTGFTSSNEKTFPVKVGPDLTHNGGGTLGFDIFVAKVKADATELLYCGYMGGDGDDRGFGIAVDSIGNAFVVGETESDETTFPMKVGPDLTYNGGLTDAFLAKVMRLSLMGDNYTISEQGGTVYFTLDAGVLHANRNYLVLGSISGTEPGIPLPGGKANLPLNWDGFTALVILYANSSFFQNFLGVLDSEGKGTAQLNLPPVQGFAGIAMYFAYALNNPWDFVSNPIGIEIVP